MTAAGLVKSISPTAKVIAALGGAFQIGYELGSLVNLVIECELFKQSDTCKCAHVTCASPTTKCADEQVVRRTEQCVAGQCVPALDVLQVCDAPTTCANAGCVCADTSLVLCGGSCVDPSTFQTDAMNCGGCGTVCPQNALCERGSCGLPIGCGVDAAGVTQRYATTDGGDWDVPVVDRQTGLIWRRQDEISLSTTADCSYDARGPYQPSTGQRAGVPMCSLAGAMQLCAERGRRLPTKQELLDIAGQNSASCAFDGWVSWSSTPGPLGQWYVDASGYSEQRDPLVQTGNGNGFDTVFGSVRCVKNP